MLKRLFKNPVFYLLILLIIFPLLFPVKEYEGFSSSSCEVSAEEFNELCKKQKMFTLFYANWCGHCKKMKPEWESAAKVANADGTKRMVMIDLGDEDKAKAQLAKDYNIRGYPTIMHVDGEQNATPYEGGRKQTDFLKELGLQ